MAKYQEQFYRPERDLLDYRIEPTKGYSYQIVRKDTEGRFVCTVTTLDCNGLDETPRKMAAMFSNAPQMLTLLMEITACHSNDLPKSLLDWIADVIDNVQHPSITAEASHA